jgi:hypothetical protein
MNLQNGLWKRFSDGNAGDIFKFISEATGGSKIDALKIVAQRVGIEPKNNNKEWTKHLEAPKSKMDKEDQAAVNVPKDEWVASAKVPFDAPKFNPAKDLLWLEKRGLEFVASYTYKNKDGELLGYAVRTHELGTGKKTVMPLTYVHNDFLDKSKWNFAGFSDNGHKPIYGHEKLAQDSDKLVLIVEGEKTADKAQKLL